MARARDCSHGWRSEREPRCSTKSMSRQLTYEGVPSQGRVLRDWLDDYVLPAFGERILPIDSRVARRSASLHVPDPKPFRDGLVAATALVHAMIIVTRNVKDFEPMGPQILDPWTQ